MGICEITKKTDRNLKLIKEEALFAGDIPIDLPIEQKKRILKNIKNQKESSICVVKYGIKIGTGFLCLISYLDKKLNVLITCNHVIDFKQGNKIKLEFREKNKEKKLEINNDRKIYTDIKFDITIIEIKKEDDFENNFLEIDDGLFKAENLEEIYLKEIIYVIHYPQGLFSSCSYGEIKNIDNNNKISHNCSTVEGSSGSPILILENNKVLGIHCRYNGNEKWNEGFILKEPLIKFFSNKDFDFQIQKKNEIYLTLEIPESDINKDIYFLDNSYFDYKNAINKSHSFLSELNDLNVKVFINGQKQTKYRKYFRPETKGVYKIRLEILTQVTNCSNMFEFCRNIKEIDLSNFNTSDVVDMSYMFKDCDSLEKLDLSYLSTKNVSNMDYMFYNCNKLSSIDLSTFNTKKVFSMENMFSKCNNLKNLNLSSFNTENVINMKNIFSYCSQLTELNLKSFETDNVTDMTGMFLNCDKLKEIKLSHSFTTDKVKSMKQMFCGCNFLKDINLTYFNTINVTDMSEMFSCCNSLTYLNLTSFDTRNVVSMRMMFNKCHDLFDLSFNTSTFINDKCRDMIKMFSGCKSLNDLKITHFHFKGKKTDNIFEDTKFEWMQNTSMFELKK